jgi:hypothetical protein
MNSSLQLDLALDSVSRRNSGPGSQREPFNPKAASTNVLHLSLPLSRVPVDFFADPDGSWDFEGLVASAGFQHELGEVAIGALSEAFAGFPAGAAVVAVSAGQHISVALVDCTRSRAAERARVAASPVSVQ